MLNRVSAPKEKLNRNFLFPFHTERQGRHVALQNSKMWWKILSQALFSRMKEGLPLPSLWLEHSLLHLENQNPAAGWRINLMVSAWTTFHCWVVVIVMLLDLWSHWQEQDPLQDQNEARAPVLCGQSTDIPKGNLTAFVMVSPERHSATHSSRKVHLPSSCCHSHTQSPPCPSIYATVKSKRYLPAAPLLLPRPAYLPANLQSH